jgi:hypothetical protein
VPAGRGLKILLFCRDEKGRGLDAALQEAARGAGIGLMVEDGAVLVDIAP